MSTRQHEPILLTTDGELVQPQSITESEPANPMLESTHEESRTGRAIRNTLRIWSPILLSLLLIVYFIFFVLAPALSLVVLSVTALLFAVYHRQYRAKITSKRIGGLSQDVETFSKDLKYIKLSGPGRW